MSEFTETQIRCLLGLAGVPVTAAHPTSGNPPPNLAAIYLPEGTKITSEKGHVRDYPDGVFAFSSVELPNRFYPMGGFGSVMFNDTHFERNFLACSVTNRSTGQRIDKDAWLARTVEAIQTMRTAGFTTMPDVKLASLPQTPAEIAKKDYNL